MCRPHTGWCRPRSRRALPAQSGTTSPVNQPGNGQKRGTQPDVTPPMTSRSHTNGTIGTARRAGLGVKPIVATRPAGQPSSRTRQLTPQAVAKGSPVHTPERDFRAPIDRFWSSPSARRIAATASIATAGIFCVMVGASPATAGGAPTAPTNTPTAPTAPPAPPSTAVAKLVANHSTITPGEKVTFTVTERTTGGAAIGSARATFYVHAKAGWKKVSSTSLSASGAATFTFHPNYTHAYRVDLASVSSGSATYQAVNTSSVTVKTDIGAAVVATAAKQKGKPYRFGAAGPSAFDCSGLTKYVFAKFGITLPHSADSQRSHGTKVTRANAKPGDLVFVMSGSHASHVAIYAGNGMWWEAPHAGAAVRKVKIWSSNVQFRRVR